MDGGSWSATVHGVAKSRTQLNDFTFTRGYRIDQCFTTTQRALNSSCDVCLWTQVLVLHTESLSCGAGLQVVCLTTYSGASPPLRVTDGVWDAVLGASKGRPIRFQLRITELFSLCLSVFFWLVTFRDISFSLSCPSGKFSLYFWTHAFTSSPISLPTSTDLISICIPLLAWEKQLCRVSSRWNDS